MDVLYKLWDQGGVLLLVLAVASFVGWLAQEGVREASFARSNPGLVRGGTAALALLLTVGICAGALDRVGSSPDKALVVGRGDDLRLVSLTHRTGKGGSSCVVRVLGLDGTYQGGSSHTGACDPQITDGLAVFRVRPGVLWGAEDRVLVDLWTGRVRDRLAPRVAAANLSGAGEYQVSRVTGAYAEIRAQDGSVRQIPIDGGEGAEVTRLSVDGPAFEGGLHRAKRLETRCAGPDRAVVLHRDVAFGEGSDLLSAVAEPDGMAWTVDLGGLWGNRPLLGVFEDAGDCVLVAGRPSARLSVVRVDGRSGAIEASWTN